MLENIIYLSPLIVLLSAIFILLFSEHTEEEQFACFKFSKIMMLIAFILTIVFYNKPLISGITMGGKYTLLFEILQYCGGFTMLYLSRKWFASMKISGNVFCGVLFVALLFGSLLIRSHNLLLSLLCGMFLMVGNYALLKSAFLKKDDLGNGRGYLFLLIFCLLMTAVCVLIFHQYETYFDYSQIKNILSVNDKNPLIFIASSVPIMVFIALLGLSPLHFWFVKMSENAFLPIFAYFIMIPVCAGWAGFIRINAEVFSPIAGDFYIFYKSVALISVFVGALGVCNGQNVRKILAYGTIYHWGIILLVMQSFSLNAVNAGLIYMLVYMLAMYGICSCLFALKIKGEYLFTLNEFEGTFYKRPYISTMLTIFIFSLLGIPPFLGFFGVFSALSYLADHDNFYQFGFIMLMLIILSYGYLQIIRKLYFEKSKENFDRADFGIYIVVLLNAVLMIVIMLKPQYLMRDIYLMIESTFL